MSSTEKKKTKKSKSSKQKERAVDPLAGSGIPPIQADWVQRDWIEEVNTNMKRIVDFLNRFGMHKGFMTYMVFIYILNRNFYPI